MTGVRGFLLKGATGVFRRHPVAREDTPCQFTNTARNAQEGRADFCALDFPSGESMPSIEYGVSGGGRAHGSATAATQGSSAQAAGPFYLRRRQVRRTSLGG